jgi:hypothetical protein
MYENGKVRPVETAPGMRGRRIREKMEGVNLTMIHCKNLDKCHNVSPVQ